MAMVKRSAGSDRVAPADRQAGAMPTVASRVVRQAHLTVCSTRCQRRWSRAGSTRQLRAHPVHHRRRMVSTRPDSSARTDQQPLGRPASAARLMIICLAVTVAAGLVYAALAELASWDTHQRLFWSGLLLIVLTGAICENAISFDAPRRRPREQPSTTRARSLGRT
jgi:hypothetical protein